MSPDRRNILLVVILGLTLGGMYFLAIDSQAPQFTFTQQQNAYNGVAGSPYRYRVLVPVILEGGMRIFGFVGSPQQAFQVASLVCECLGFIFQLGMMYVFLRQFFQPMHALVGVTFTAGMSVLTLAYFTYQPWSILEVAFFALGFLLAYRGKWVGLTAVVVLASLNRETGVFLPLAVLLATLNDLRPFGLQTLRRAAKRRETYVAFGLVLLSTAIFLGLRLVRGSAEPVDALPDVIRRNLERNNLIAAAMGIPLLLGFGWIFALLGFRGVCRYAPQGTSPRTEITQEGLHARGTSPPGTESTPEGRHARGGLPRTELSSEELHARGTSPRAESTPGGFRARGTSPPGTESTPEGLHPSGVCFLRRIARVVPFYLVAFAIWGWWREVRILTSLYPVLVPLVLAYCCSSRGTARKPV
ncbi:MAG: hypothetical protein JO020_18700 [Chloroflexi bacterium]|nr:hypothetical protein [Chloroflexota bacterium]MBV9133626.1 hypothetical protein [Chloroflexota bacterium]MBV9896197.1 hypothetical protein [Chloroflexota bacterium]